MKITIIIPTLNAGNRFHELLKKLKHQITVDSQILVIDSSSSDTTPIIAETFGCILLNISQQDFNHANTRNITLEYDADFYLFMTQDTLPYDHDLICELHKAFEDPDVVVAYARQIPKSDADPIERFARETNYPPTSCVKTLESIPIMGIKTFFTSDSCAMYRGDYFRQIGGFTRDLNTSEDMEFAARAILANKKIAYCADAKVFHSHQFTLLEYWKRYREIGKFFRHNQWILDTISRHKNIESSGIRQAVTELIYLSRRAPLYLIRSLMISTIKFIAFKVGFKL